MKKALDAPMATGRIKRCGTCSHGTSHFKIVGKTHLHCGHTDEKISGENNGWDTLRYWFDKGCAEWSPRVKEENPHRGSECVICGGCGYITATKPTGEDIRLSCHECNSPHNVESIHPESKPQDHEQK